MPKISAFLQNKVYNALFDLMGTTSTGYGATLIANPVVPGDLIRADNWDNLRVDIERCLIHQTGTSTNDVYIANTGTLAEFSVPARMYTDIQYLQKNVGTVDPSQLETFTHNTRRVSDAVWTSTNYSSTVTMLAGQGYITAVNWSWFYESQLNYFFNLGGKMSPEVSIVGGRTIERSAWTPLVAAVNNVQFGRTEYLQALSNPSKTFTFVVSGSGDTTQSPALRALTTPWVKHLKPIYNTKYKNTKQYSANAITVTFKIMNNTVVGTLNFLVGLGFKHKGSYKKTGKIVTKKWNKKHNLIKGYYVQDIFTRNIIGRYIAVRVQFDTDFVTTYPNGSNGGIAAQLPQTQIVANSLSASPAPVPQFTMGIDENSLVETVTLRNNSTYSCHVSDITLSGYSTGTVTPRVFSIDPHSSQDIQIQYSGTAPGHYRGYVNILNDVNPLVLFTEVNVGSTSPKMLDVNTSTYDLISQNFLVNHAGGYFKDFSVTMSTSTGFSLTPLIEGTDDKFNITFNGYHFANGTYTTTATVVINPLDSSQQPTVWTVPLTVSLNVTNRHLGDWESCILGNNTRLGISYDIIDGRTYITAGIGSNNPVMTELRSDELTFASWAEVYRMPLENTTTKLYSRDYCVKFAEGSEFGFRYGNYFGVGTAEQSLLTLNYDKGNVEVLMNTLYQIPSENTTEAIDLSTAFRYYDSTRRYQLQSETGLTEGGETYVFAGFERTGDVVLNLVIPN